jgi:acyl-CoA hydrolase
MDWRDMVGSKLMSPQEAVQVVKSGDRVAAAPINCTPHTLCQALYDRRQDLTDVRIDHLASLFPWLTPGEETIFDLHEGYTTGVNRETVVSGEASYHPLARWLDGEFPDGFVQEPDVFLVPVSPPDRHGMCSFGPGVFFSPIACRRSKIVIAEVHEGFIRTGGENFVHLSQIDRLCEAGRPTGGWPVQRRNEEETLTTEVICTLVANDLVRDGDTLQIGIGTVSIAMAAYLENRRDLGIQTEIITGGVAELVHQGVINGRYKTVHPGKVVASAVLVPEEEMHLIDGHPAFELYNFGYVDDVRMLVRQDNLVAINNALFVDLTGQVASETIGPRIWSGVGGQTAFSIAANYSKGGRSITTLPSSHVINGQRVSRVMPMLPEGTTVTVPRTLVDYVVTEHGIAHLRGKTIRERIGEMVLVAHPDFRAELRAEARRLYNIDV